LKNGATVVENRLMGLPLDANYARTRNGIVESYLTDALGSTLELRDSAQNPTVRYTYAPYGKTTASDSSTNLVKYTGREQDLADLYYYRYRYYKPSIGRFISEDPIGLAGGFNIYAYTLNDPVQQRDPSGLLSITIGGLTFPPKSLSEAKDWKDEIKKWLGLGEKVVEGVEDTGDIRDAFVDPEKTQGEKGAVVLDKCLKWCDKLLKLGTIDYPICKVARKVLEKGVENEKTHFKRIEELSR